MTSQGERLFTIVTGAILSAFVVFLIVGCQEKSNEIAPEVRALEACNQQPSITVKTYAGTEAAPGNLTSDVKYESLERDKHILDSVAKCRSDVLNYFAGRRETTEVK